MLVNLEELTFWKRRHPPRHRQRMTTTNQQNQSCSLIWTSVQSQCIREHRRALLSQIRTQGLRPSSQKRQFKGQRIRRVHLAVECRLLRSLPENKRIFAVPEFEDERHMVTRPDGSVVTVFAPDWVPVEKIRSAAIDWKKIDWGVVRPTSRREDKWVYFPPEDQELLKKCK